MALDHEKRLPAGYHLAHHVELDAARIRQLFTRAEVPRQRVLPEWYDRIGSNFTVARAGVRQKGTESGRGSSAQALVEFGSPV